MKKVLILGAGLVTKTMANYLMDKCNYEVIIASRTVSKAEKIVKGKPLGKAVSWTLDQLDILEEMVKEVDLVACMIPQTAADTVASICLKQNKHFLQTDYLSPYLISIDEEARKKDIVIMNEIGEDPGLDHMGAIGTIHKIQAEGGKVTSLASYATGLPSFEHNRNPMGYKFAWSPHGLMMSAKATAGYLRNGVKIDVPLIFEHHGIVEIDGIGTFETYPNRDCERYAGHFGLDKDISLYRGLLRFVGYCNTMNSLKKLGFFTTEEEEKSFKDLSYAQMMASLINAGSPIDIKKKVSSYLNKEERDDIMERLEWLGLFEEKPISVEKGIYSDVLVDLMIKKMSYAPEEKDMVIIFDEIIAEFPHHKEKITASLLVEGIPYGESAMSRAVSLPASITIKLILEGKIKSRGTLMPNIPEIYNPVLEEMKTFGFEFKKKRIRI